MALPITWLPSRRRDAHQADIRADIYSLGCTFYCLLTGGPPFTKGSSLHKLLAHQDQSPVPIADVRPEVPEQVIRLVERMLAKDPAERPQTPAEVAQALAPVHHTVLELDETILAAPSPRHESSPAYKPGFLKKPGLRLAYLAASIILLCALSGGIGLAVWAVLKSGIYSPQDTTAVTQPTDGGTTNDSAGNGGTARVAAVSPGVETPRIEHRAALDPKPPVRVERPAVAVPAEPRNNDVREQALVWIKANARSGPDCNFVADIDHHLRCVRKGE